MSGMTLNKEFEQTIAGMFEKYDDDDMDDDDDDDDDEDMDDLNMNLDEYMDDLNMELEEFGEIEVAHVWKDSDFGANLEPIK